MGDAVECRGEGEEEWMYASGVLRLRLDVVGGEEARGRGRRGRGGGFACGEASVGRANAEEVWAEDALQE